MLYSHRLSITAWTKEWGVPLLVCFCTYAMLWASHAPREIPELAYVFLLPTLVWFHFQPSLTKVVACTLFTGWIYQVALVGWMRHVSFSGMCIATFILSGYHVIWFVFSHIWFRHFARGNFSTRFLIIIGLSALWVAIEWIRTLFTLGFPWCPLSVSQWTRPVILQAVSFGGGWIVSFFLVFFNLCIGSYLHFILIRRYKEKGFFNRCICPELYLGLLLLFLMIYPYFTNRNLVDDEKYKVLRVGICQPYLLNKWEDGEAVKHKQTLRRQTEFLSFAKPDIILWPEASTPYPINLDRLWVEELANKTGVPILAGSVIREEDASYNAMAYIDPNEGMNPEWYAKQILVPFGEYVPWPFKWIPGLEKMVGPVGNFSSGDRTHLFELPLRDGNLTTFIKAGVMICYEDIFPLLPRKLAKHGAEVLIVSTNDAWFQEEGCAEQHAAHSVLRAVENHLPIVRCGNAGWSGWIDERGHIRDILSNEKDSIYFEGAAIVEVRIPFTNRRLSFSTFGDNFAYFSTLLFLGIALYVRGFKKMSAEKYKN